jgi:hypothetical protein
MLAPSPEDRRQARHADALLMLASRTIATDGDPDRATVVIHTALPPGLARAATTEASVPTGCEEASCRQRWSELSGGPVLHPEVARRLSCDARVELVVTDQSGNALGIGRASRTPPAWMLRQLVFRDRGCTFPGCELNGFVQAHHVIHWEDGGPTDLDNLVLVCHFHHKLVHEFGWRVALNGSMVEWFRPGGARFEPGPDPPPRQAPTAEAEAAA